jgi:phytoene synthase
MTPELDPDRRLALAYVPAAKRAAVEALWRLDVTLGAVPAGGGEPMVSRIRLAWWREALERLDREAPPAGPLLQALAAHVIPAGVSGSDLAAMEEGWAILLTDGPLLVEDMHGYAAARGERLFRHSAALLGGADRPVEPAGARWALVDLARHSASEAEAAAALDAASRIRDETRWPKSLRPLGMLSMLAARDVRRGAGTWEIQGSPARMFRMARHRLGGR